MSDNLLNELTANRDFLSNTERKITDIILDDPKKFTSYSMTELSKLAEISQGSIINFANKFAHGGFPTLKLEIAACIKDYTPTPFSVVEKNDGMMRVLEKTNQDIGYALKNTEILNDEKTLESVADRIFKAKKVEIYGIFRSAVVANDFYFQLLQIGIPASFVGDVLTCSVSASMLESDCLVVAVSSSGRTKDIIDAVKIAKENNVPVVCLTGDRNSPLAKMSDDVLVAASSGKSVSENSTEIRISQLALTDAICSYLRSRTDERGEKRYEKQKRILELHNVED